MLAGEAGFGRESGGGGSTVREADTKSQRQAAVAVSIGLLLLKELPNPRDGAPARGRYGHRCPFFRLGPARRGTETTPE